MALLALIVTVVALASATEPLIRPLVALTVSPGGRPDAPKPVGEFVAVIWYANALPALQTAEAGLVMTGVAGWITMESSAVPVPVPLTAPIVALLVPTVAGTPLIKPVSMFNDKPAGRIDTV